MLAVANPEKIELQTNSTRIRLSVTQAEAALGAATLPHQQRRWLRHDALQHARRSNDRRSGPSMVKANTPASHK